MSRIFFLLASTLIWSCSARETRNAASLTDTEKQYCDSLKLDTTILVKLRAFTRAEVEPFHYSLGRQINPDGTEIEIDPIHLPGLVFKEETANTEVILENLRSSLAGIGYSIFTLDRNYNVGGKPDVMAILKTTDKYEILSQVKTDGINYNIDNDSLIRIVKIFDQKYSLDLAGASGDWCEFMITKEPDDWNAFAEEAYKFCPDIVDQGTGSVEALAEEMKKTRRLYFWWD